MSSAIYNQRRLTVFNNQIITWKQFPKEHTFNHNYESCWELIKFGGFTKTKLEGNTFLLFFSSLNLGTKFTLNKNQRH